MTSDLPDGYKPYHSLFNSISPGDRVTVRCGVCRDRSLKRYGTRRADIVGWLEEGDSDIEFVPAIKRHEAPDGESRFLVSNRESAASWGIDVRCRNGHQLRVAGNRLDTLVLSADGDLYLPGN